MRFCVRHEVTPPPLSWVAGEGVSQGAGDDTHGVCAMKAEWGQCKD